MYGKEPGWTTRSISRPSISGTLCCFVTPFPPRFFSFPLVESLKWTSIKIRINFYTTIMNISLDEETKRKM